MLSLEKSEKIGKIASYTPSNRFLKLKVSSLWLKISRKYADDQTSRQDHQNQIFFYFRCLDGVYNGRNQNWFLRGIVNGFSTCQIKQFCAEVSVDRLTLTCLYIFARFPHSKCLGVGECDMTSHNIGYFLSLNQRLSKTSPQVFVTFWSSAKQKIEDCCHWAAVDCDATTQMHLQCT